MKAMLTLDYELFLGGNAGTLEKCILEPTEKLLAVLDPFGVKASFFVDSGYIYRLMVEKQRNPNLQSDYEKIIKQISYLYANGHDIQLHVHPHWEDCKFENDQWKMDTRRFKLSDFDKKTVADIVDRYMSVLENAIEDDVFAYRAGGWCIQPFDHISTALSERGITVDSTVYRDGRSHNFDFSGILHNDSVWRFSSDPLVKEDDGDFMEIPIAAMSVSPMFYWMLAITRKMGKEKHKIFGDGSSVPASKNDLFRLLTRFSTIAVSMDGYKSSLLWRAFKKHKRKQKGQGYFVVIGHPKTFSSYSLNKLQQFLSDHTDQCEFTTYRAERAAGRLI